MPREEREIDLLVLGHRAMGVPGTQLAALLGVTPKTVYRWYGGRSSVTSVALGDLAPHVHPHDPALAKRIHDFAARKLARLRLRPPPPLPIPPTPEPPAGIAQRAGVRYLLFDHIIPPLPTTALDGPFLGRAPQIFHGAIRVGQDGDFVSLPAGGTQISYTNRLHNIW